MDASRLMETLQIASARKVATGISAAPLLRPAGQSLRLLSLPLSGGRGSEGGILRLTSRCLNKGREESGGGVGAGFRSLQEGSAAVEEREEYNDIFENGKDSSIDIEFPKVDHASNNSSNVPVMSGKEAEEKEVETAMDVKEGTKPETRVTYSIVIVSAEAAPYSKTGGLGDVCGSLPIALAARGHRVMVVSPRYLNGVSDDVYSGASDCNCHHKVLCFGGEHEVAFFHEYRGGVDWVFVDHSCYHRPGNPYGDIYGAFGDNQYRFTLLCHAACEAPLLLPLGGYTYGEKCLFLVNDWHASLWYGALEWIFPNWARKHALDKGEAVNVLKGAIVTADRIMTVSQGYAWEITTPEGGYGLHEILSSRKIVLDGVTNGINTDEWDPTSDDYIPFHYSVDDPSGKVKCKTALQKELGFDVRPDCPLIGFIGRLDYQKGVDLIKAAVSDVMQDDVQFVMLGSGVPEIENWMRWAESRYKDKFRGWVGFNVPISHRITAGCDILLMPSIFEPCGLNQLYAMRYGTVPIVHCTGGLRDTVENFNPYAYDGKGKGTGYAVGLFSTLEGEHVVGFMDCPRDIQAAQVFLGRSYEERDVEELHLGQRSCPRFVCHKKAWQIEEVL
ncbi:Pentafunctional AROM polypeptide [Asimina triloba]